jgi:hypothetical protein
LNDGPEPLDGNLTFEGLGIQDKDIVTVTKCRHVQVTVEFAGRSFEETYNPSNKVQVVLKDAFKEFNIPQADQGDYHLFKSAADKTPIPADERLVSLLTGSCTLTLYFNKKDDTKG